MDFRRHALVFAAGNGALHVANFFTGAPWWAFWPLIAWALVLGVHYMFHRARRSDERWARSRTDDVRARSYDRAHMDDIQARYTDPDKK